MRKRLEFACPVCGVGKMGRGATKCRACANRLRAVSDQTKERLSAAKREDRNPNWAGSRVGYSALHVWVRRNFEKPKLCECCGDKPGYDWANITGKYLREREDWEHLCRSCHMKKDGRLEQAIKNLNGG